MSHLENLERTLGNFSEKKILDVGAGKGGFLVECAGRQYDAIGIEVNHDKIRVAQDTAASLGVPLQIIYGVAEDMPFMDDTFDFANASEVTEHVNDPAEMMCEIYRVLKPSGVAYVSAHNRFGMYDTHFHVWGLGWMPRRVAEMYLGVLGKHKNYESSVDYQRISEMHYFTFSSFKKLVRNAGFEIVDGREEEINRRYSGAVRLIASGTYKFLLRPFYFSTFHIILKK